MFPENTLDGFGRSGAQREEFCLQKGERHRMVVRELPRPVPEPQRRPRAELRRVRLGASPGLPEEVDRLPQCLGVARRWHAQRGHPLAILDGLRNQRQARCCIE